MAEQRWNDERLREAFAARADRAVASDACPEPEELWAAARGELPPDRLRRVGLHATTCPACAEAWQLARELGSAVEPRVVPFDLARRRRRLRRQWVGGLVAAAAAVLVVVLLPNQDPILPPAEAPMRGEQEIVRPVIAHDAPLPRSDFVLEWQGPRGSRYDLRVATEELRVLDEAFGLDRPRYVVPPGRLAGLPAGSRIVWQIHATLPDGRRVASRSFVQRVE
jgi:hypothetical protein